VENWQVPYKTDRLATLERDVLDRTVPVADALRSCLYLARRTQAVQLDEWVTAELKGYRLATVPDYRKVAAPILRVFDVPGHGLVSEIFDSQTLPEGIREHLNGIVPLTQSVDDLEGYIAQYGVQNKQIELEVFGNDLMMNFWNENHPFGPRAVSMYWSISPAAILGVLGQIRTALTEFVVELRNEVGDGDELPSAEQADWALRAVLPSAVFNNSTVTVLTATTKNGDIMPDGPRTTIKDNKTEIRGATGNMSVASAHVAQVNADSIDLEKLRQFADLLTQIAPTLGLSADQQMELKAGVSELQAAAADSGQDQGRFRKALSRVLRVLRTAGTSAAQQVAISMGDELIHELGAEIARGLPH
jgi:hypothetical protein